MTTRLDRLFVLLDKGESELTRQAAAQQLGQLQRLHPHRLNYLLAKVNSYLKSPTWETRAAAGTAVARIAENVLPWAPTPAPKRETPSEGQTPESSTSDGAKLRLETFDIERVLRLGKPLLGFEGKHFEKRGESENGTETVEDLERQKSALNKRIGLDILEKLGMTSDLFSETDLKSEVMESANESPKRDIDEVLGLRRVKRPSVEEDEPPRKMVKLENTEETPAENETTPEECCTWPFEEFCANLMAELFSPSWVIRHGAAKGLREVIQLHGTGAGVCKGMTSEEMVESNQAYLEDLALRFVCVLALDKLCDFIADQVIAPVRESTAQALGFCLQNMEIEGVNSILGILLKLTSYGESWEARHGGLLGIMYLLATSQHRGAEREAWLPLVFPPLFANLIDKNDDISTVSARALFPIINDLSRVMPDQTVPLVERLFVCLEDMDELSSCTEAILTLLSKMLPHTCRLIGVTSSKIERLWPYLYHHSQKVRISVLESLRTISENEGPDSALLTEQLATVLRLLFQRALLETEPNVLKSITCVWTSVLKNADLGRLLFAACPLLSGWLCLTMHPSKMAIKASQVPVWLDLKNGKDADYFIGGKDSLTESAPNRERIVLQARLTTCRMLGFLSCFVTKPAPDTDDTGSPLEFYLRLLLFHLTTKSALQRTMASLVLKEWLNLRQEQQSECDEIPASVSECVLQRLQEPLLYDEVATSFTRLQLDCRDLISLLRYYKLPIDETEYVAKTVMTAVQANTLANQVVPELLKDSKLRANVTSNIEEKCKMVINSSKKTVQDQQTLGIMTLGALSALLTCLPDRLPNKLNAVIKPLMESLKKETNRPLQEISSKSLAILMKHAITRDPCPNPKVLKNLVGYICCDCEETPLCGEGHDLREGILTLQKMNKAAERFLASKRPGFKRAQSTSTAPTTPTTPTEVAFTPPAEDEAAKAAKELLETQMKGGELAFSEIGHTFSNRLFVDLPDLWNLIVGPLDSHVAGGSVSEETAHIKSIIEGLQTLEAICPSVDSSLHSELDKLLPRLDKCTQHPLASVRHMAARCFAQLAKANTKSTMKHLIRNILKQLGASHDDILRQGAIETIFNVMERLEISVVPYISFLVVPILSTMADQNEDVRLLATQCFANLVCLMPLDSGPAFCEIEEKELCEEAAKQRKFISQLLDAQHAENYELSVAVEAELRSYQQVGINWLAFLNRFNLHGILCDDMGLGKTLQSICMLASDHQKRQEEFTKTRSVDVAPLPSMVVCPPTLTGHWMFEIKKFVDKKFVDPLQYTGPPVERQRIQRLFKERQKKSSHNLVVIASYDLVRNDIKFFSEVHWNYIILDEGHVIKNNKTKLSIAIKQLRARHRLILSGTPIQNNVTELWNLFDFLMPGFLGSEKRFTARFAKPILASRDAKASSKELEMGHRAMEALHRQVLPFVLRRTKEEVLTDLPSKIIQDYYCDLSPLQQRLYEDFSKSKANSEVFEALESQPDSVARTHHVFQALHYLRKVCNHPKLALSPLHPEYDSIVKELRDNKTSLNDINVSSKLLALRQLLNDCGIGTTDENIVNPHRCLVFFQYKSMLDLVENDLFRKHMSSVSYLRLDGSVPPAQRHSLVEKFNNDLSVDVLLLTSQVGGLGVNLTGADTVIFVEHDWNPMKDLQAMDRAHRIGQKRVVNVYRLITRNTLEEKIMGQQRFKMSIANTVINNENTSLHTMGTDQVLDLFSMNKGGQQPSTERRRGGSLKNVLDNLPDLWDPSQYETEYDLTMFMKNLEKQPK